MNDLNPRERIGGNEAPDFAKQTTERLAEEYRGLIRTLDELVEEVKGQPAEVMTDEQALKMGALIKRLRDLRERLENTRTVEKEPHLRAGNAIDSFFNGYKKKIAADDKTERRVSPGYIDDLQGRINAHQDRKEAAERERLERERIERERVAKEARDKAERDRLEAERLQREADERQREAERARKPEIVEQKRATAAEASQAAAAAAGQAAGSQIVAGQATDDAQEARIGTLAKSADVVRVRGVTPEGAGVTLTSARDPYAFVIDREKLDPVKLFRFFTDQEVDKAVRAFARNTGHREMMAGAEIGLGRKGVTR